MNKTVEGDCLVACLALTTSAASWQVRARSRPLLYLGIGAQIGQSEEKIYIPSL